jgi:hypothetical protein
VAFSALASAQRVALTAAASRRGFLASASILAKRFGSLAKKSSMLRAAFF